MIKTFSIFAFLTLLFPLVLGSGAPVYAQTNQTSAGKKAENSWQVNCSTRPDTSLQCVIKQTLTHTQSGKTMLISQVSKKTAKDLPQLTFRLPHDVLLQKGVTFSIDKAHKRIIPIVRADQNGSYAGLKLEGNLMSLLRTGKVMNVLIHSANGRGITFNLPLTGFAESSKHLK